MTLIKFCGITRAEDAQAAARLGVDAIGLVFAAGSPRAIAPARAAKIRQSLAPPIRTVALFRNAEAALVHEVIAAVQPDLLQFHGEESGEFCERFDRDYWRAVPMGAPQDLRRWEQEFPRAAALLLDGHAAGEPGGQGRAFAWQTIEACGRPIVVAGGLDSGNVGDAVRQLRPYGVDVSSGIESTPGVKDVRKMERFVAAVRQADGR